MCNDVVNVIGQFDIRILISFFVLRLNLATKSVDLQSLKNVDVFEK